MNLLSYIAYKRQGIFDPEKIFKRCGRLYYDPVLHKSRIFMQLYHQGLCIAKPQEQEGAPYLQGDIVFPLDFEGGMTTFGFCGFITTSETANGDYVYSIKMESLPLYQYQGGIGAAGIWLTVKLEDEDGYEPHKNQ